LKEEPSTKEIELELVDVELVAQELGPPQVHELEGITVGASVMD
jgi:hypothetical protein